MPRQVSHRAVIIFDVFRAVCRCGDEIFLIHRPRPWKKKIPMLVWARIEGHLSQGTPNRSVHWESIITGTVHQIASVTHHIEYGCLYRPSRGRARFCGQPGLKMSALDEPRCGAHLGV